MALKTPCLLGVLLVARLLNLWGGEIGPSLWAPIAYLWQDLLVLLLFGGLEVAFPRSRLLWIVYAALVVFHALNVAVVLVLSTPLTLPMLRAASGTLADSISHHLTLGNLTAVAAVLSVGVLLPWRLRRWCPNRSALGVALGGAVPLILLGPIASEELETGGRHRNGLVTMVASMFPRVSAADEVSDSRLLRASREAMPRADLRHLRGRAAGSNVVLVLLESTGAAYLGMYGAPEDPMPNLTRRAGNGVVFENAYAVYPESIKGLLSVLDSIYPALDSLAHQYSSAGSSLPRRLRGAGYRTALFHSGRFAYLGMDHVIEGRGFELLADAGTIGGVDDSSFGIDERSTVQHLLAWVDSLDSGGPFFVTYLPVAGHHPYDAPEPGPFEGELEIDAYRNALHYADTAIEGLIAGFEARGLARDTLFLFLGDHGQAFGQHPGNYGHVFHIYEENVRVPLLLLAPGLVEDGTRLGGIASSIDIAPTVLDLLGLPDHDGFQGSSLLDPTPRAAFFFCDYSQACIGLREGPWKLIHELETGRASLYHLGSDPGEREDVAARHGGRVADYKERLLRWVRSQRALLKRNEH